MLWKQQGASKSPRASSGFLESLNAKFSSGSQQQQANQGSSRSANIRRIMGNRVPIKDPIQVRDSLMDQIRRGTSLRKTSGPINDRSAPKIYWTSLHWNTFHSKKKENIKVPHWTFNNNHISHSNNNNNKRNRVPALCYVSQARFRVNIKSNSNI